jgi:hypothetical protein
LPARRAGRHSLDGDLRTAVAHAQKSGTGKARSNNLVSRAAINAVAGLYSTNAEVKAADFTLKIIFISEIYTQNHYKSKVSGTSAAHASRS